MKAKKFVISGTFENSENYIKDIRSQLEEYLEKHSKTYNFDFKKGEPLTENSRFMWNKLIN